MDYYVLRSLNTGEYCVKTSRAAKSRQRDREQDRVVWTIGETGHLQIHGPIFEKECLELKRSLEACDAIFKMPRQTEKWTPTSNEGFIEAVEAPTPKSKENNFPVLRSKRKTERTIHEERLRHIENCLLTEVEDGLKVLHFPGKGRGVVATRPFNKGDFVVEYAGELTNRNEARIRERNYAKKPNIGCYMYYFKYQNVQYCIDATPESKRVGRLLNHSTDGNVVTKVITVGGRPRLALIAKDKINVGDEVMFDYGDRRKAAIFYHPWLTRREGGENRSNENEQHPTTEAPQKHAQEKPNLAKPAPDTAHGSRTQTSPVIDSPIEDDGHVDPISARRRIPRKDIAHGSRTQSSPVIDSPSEDARFAGPISARKKIPGEGPLKNVVVDDRVQHCCYFCNSLAKRIDRHLAKEHIKTREMRRINKITDRASRKRELDMLVRKGDYAYNMERLLMNKPYELKLIRSGRNRILPVDKYGPCPYCLGFMQCSQMYRHAQRCPAKESDRVDSKSIQQLSSSMIWAHRNPDKDERFRKCVERIRKDDVGLAVMADELILLYGARRLETRGLRYEEFVRQKMRQLGRLLLILNNIAQEDKGLKEHLTVDKFDDVVYAVKELCESSDGDVNGEELNKPGLALHLGHAIKKCVCLMRGLAIRMRDDFGKSEAEGFLLLMNDEWASRVSCPALYTMTHRKRNASDLLPLTEDLMQLNEYMNAAMDTALTNLNESATDSNWIELERLTLAKLILFNKRRSGEAAQMTCADYEKKRNFHESNPNSEILASLSASEKVLAENMEIISIVGKNRRAVPVLMPAKIAAAMKQLNDTRKELGLDEHNPFFFANIRGGGTTSVRGNDAVRYCVAKASLKKPENINSTGFRKYAATVAQIMLLSSQEKEWFIQHMGHSMSVHLEYYRVHHNAIEMAKVGGLLVAMEQGRIHNFAGKGLDDINLEDIELVEGDVPSQDQQPPEVVHLVSPAKKKPTPTVAPTSRKSRYDEDDEDDHLPHPKRRTSKKTKPKTRATFLRQPWEAHEKKDLFAFFDKYLKSNRLPGLKEMDMYLKGRPHLDRTVSKVKCALHNELKRREAVLKTQQKCLEK